MADLKLEEYIAPKYVEAIKEMVEDHKNLSEKDFYEKYAEAVSGVWDDFEDYKWDKDTIDDRLSFFAIHYLVNNGYCLQEDGDVEEEYIIKFCSDDIENAWGTEDVKMMNVNLGNDQYYLIFVPSACKVKKFIKAPMKAFGNKKNEKVPKELVLMEKFRNDRSQAFIDSIPKIDNLDYRNDFGESYLYAACEECNYYAVKALLDLGFDPNDVNKFQSYPGRLAALSDHFLAVDVFCLFLEKGINLELPTFRGTIRSDIMDGNNEVMKEAVRMYLEEHKIYPLNREERDAEYVQLQNKRLAEKKEKEKAIRIERERRQLEERIAIVDECKKEIKEILQSARKEKEYYSYPELAMQYSKIAREQYVFHKQFEEGRKNAFRAALCQALVLEHYHELGICFDLFLLHHYTANQICFALMADHEKLAKRIAMDMEIHPEINEDIDEYFLYPARALKYVVLDEKEKAEEVLAVWDSTKMKSKTKKMYESHGLAYKALLYRDEKMFNEALPKMFACHDKLRVETYGHTYWHEFSYEAIGLTMLARKRGMNVTVRHELLKDDYLQNIAIDYEALEKEITETFFE